MWCFPSTHVWKTVAEFAEVPQSFQQIHRFSNKYKTMINMIEDHQSRIGGARIKAHISAHDIDTALQRCEALCSIEALVSRGLQVKRISISTLLFTLNYAYGFADDLKIFQTRNSRDTLPSTTKSILADLLSLAGVSHYWLKRYTETTGNLSNPFAIWRALTGVPDPDNFYASNIVRMYEKLRIAKTRNGGGYTLSM